MGRNNIISLLLLFLLFIFSECFAAEISQKTAGNQSPSIYAPAAKEIAINYGLSEQDVINLFRQLFQEQEKKLQEQGKKLQEDDKIIKGKTKDIESKLKELEDRNATIRDKEAKILEWTVIAERLNKQISDNASIKQIAALKAITPYEFLDNFIIFHSYNQNRQTFQLLNPDMLVKLLEIYFRSILLYPSGSQTKYYITAPDGRLMLLQIQGHNDKGENISISLPHMSASLLQDVCWDFIKSADSGDYKKMEHLLDCALATPELDKNLKINILDLKNCISKNKLFLNK